MVRRAVEASRPDDPVRISCKVQNGDVEFQVHNGRQKGISPILALMASRRLAKPCFLFFWAI
jgi:hypothetical protein